MTSVWPLYVLCMTSVSPQTDLRLQEGGLVAVVVFLMVALFAGLGRLQLGQLRLDLRQTLLVSLQLVALQHAAGKPRVKRRHRATTVDATNCRVGDTHIRVAAHTTQQTQVNHSIKTRNKY